jgi:hypothetical protein
MQIATELLASASKQSVSLLTPRAKAWLGSLALPEDQAGHIALALAEHAYTSVETIRQESEEGFMKISRIEGLKPGAKIALAAKLAELKKVLQHTIRCCTSNRIHTTWTCSDCLSGTLCHSCPICVCVCVCLSYAVSSVTVLDDDDAG